MCIVKNHFRYIKLALELTGQIAAHVWLGKIEAVTCTLPYTFSPSPELDLSLWGVPMISK